MDDTTTRRMKEITTNLTREMVTKINIRETINNNNRSYHHNHHQLLNKEITISIIKGITA